ncbi:MAG: hypothetical protein CVU69_03830 [Deltaproteobacteria bacterium HGW-Deltaproteobacteria-4]|nr:MAG: hypothetical protein CVU69_03830 [Deltaproteobacteria bacterium HGW-Deltaproteobacteria-4]
MKRTRLSAFLLAAAFAAMTPLSALAAGTPVCTDITNTASLTYAVGGVTQPVENGTATPFEVASKVNLTVITADAAPGVSVVPGTGTLQAVLEFTVTNIGNTVQDYILTPVTKANGTYTVWAANDSVDTFNASGVVVVVESGDAVGYDVLDVATYIDELAPDTSRTVYIVATGTPAIAVALANGSKAVYALNANTAAGGTAAALGAETTNASTYNGPGCTAAVPVVLADTAAGTGPEDGNLDGADSAYSVFVVSSADISVNKVATTLWDPINYTTTPKAIPGAIVQYVVTITNDAGAPSSATLTSIGDTLIASLLMDADLLTDFSTPATPAAESAAGSGFKASVTGSRIGNAGSGLAGGNVAKYYTTTSDADGVELSGQAITATLATLLPAEASYTVGELKPGEVFTLTFNVIIQ